MAGTEQVGGRPQVDAHPLRLWAGRGQPGQPVGDVDRPALLVHVAQAGEEVGVRTAGAGEQFRGDRTGDLQGEGQRLAGVGQDVGPPLQFAVVLRPGVARPRTGAADRRRGVGGVVGVPAGFAPERDRGGTWPAVLQAVDCAWIVIFLALVLGYHRAARTIAALAVATDLVAMLQIQVAGLTLRPLAWWSVTAAAARRAGGRTRDHRRRSGVPRRVPRPLR
jgi:hypothetical protein